MVSGIWPEALKSPLWRVSRLPIRDGARLNAMSALGQKQTYALQQASRFTPKATTKADSRKRACPLCTQKQTCAAHDAMSALGQ